MFRRLTWEQTALVGAVLLVVWPVFRTLIAARRRRRVDGSSGEA